MPHHPAALAWTDRKSAPKSALGSAHIPPISKLCMQYQLTLFKSSLSVNRVSHCMIHSTACQYMKSKILLNAQRKILDSSTWSLNCTYHAINHFTNTQSLLPSWLTVTYNIRFIPVLSLPSSNWCWDLILVDFAVILQAWNSSWVISILSVFCIVDHSQQRRIRLKISK